MLDMPIEEHIIQLTKKHNNLITVMQGLTGAIQKLVKITRDQEKRIKALEKTPDLETRIEKLEKGETK